MFTPKSSFERKLWEKILDLDPRARKHGFLALDEFGISYSENLMKWMLIQVAEKNLPNITLESYTVTLYAMRHAMLCRELALGAYILQNVSEESKLKNLKFVNIMKHQVSKSMEVFDEAMIEMEKEKLFSFQSSFIKLEKFSENKFDHFMKEDTIKTKLPHLLMPKMSYVLSDEVYNRLGWLSKQSCYRDG